MDRSLVSFWFFPLIGDFDFTPFPAVAGGVGWFYAGLVAQFNLHISLATGVG